MQRNYPTDPPRRFHGFEFGLQRNSWVLNWFRKRSDMARQYRFPFAPAPAGLAQQRKIREVRKPPDFCLQLAFRPGEIRRIMSLKGWSSDRDMAEALGFTKNYICQLRAGAKVSSEVIARLAQELNNQDGAWWSHFELVERHPESLHSPRNNQAKARGQMPYSARSCSSDFRALDNPMEKR